MPTRTDYTVKGAAMTLSEATSRACGHLAEFPGEEMQDGITSAAWRSEMRLDATVLANTLRKTVEIYASHPTCQPWKVDEVAPQEKRGT
jgi:hypothetical protein